MKKKEIKERLITEILKIINISFLEKDNFTLTHFLESIVNSKRLPFDVAYYITLDKRTTKFSFGDIFPESYLGLKEQIINYLDISNCKIKDEVNEKKMGMYCLVAKKNLCDKEQKPYVEIIDNFEEFKKKDEFKYYIKLDFGKNKIKSEYIFPIFIKSTGESKKKNNILFAILILNSFKEIKLSKNDIKLLSEIVSTNISISIKHIAYNKFFTFFNNMSSSKENYKSNVEMSNSLNLIDLEYTNILLNIKEVFSLNENSFVGNCELKHASMWSINNTNSKNHFLIKEKNLIPFQGNDDLLTITSELKTNNGKDNHYFFNYVNNNLAINVKKLSEEKKFSILIKKEYFKNIKKNFLNPKFEEKYNILDDDMVVIFPILPHMEKNNNLSTNIHPLGFIVLYFSFETSKYFYNDQILELISHKIFENIRIIVASMRREIRTKILSQVHNSILSDQNQFYSNAILEMQTKLAFKDGYVYLFDEEDKENLTMRCQNSPKIIKRVINVDDKSHLEDITKITGNKNISSKFRASIKYFHRNKTKPIFWNNFSEVNKLKSSKTTNLFSCMLIPIKNTVKKNIGVLICLNNERKISINKSNNVMESPFSSIDAEIAGIGAEIIGMISELFNYSKEIQNVFMKLQHEIPGLATRIYGNVTKLKRNVLYHLKSMTKYDRRNVDNLIDSMLLSSRTIGLYSRYANLQSFTKKEANSNKDDINIRNFLTGYIGEYRDDAQKLHGVFPLFHINDSNRIRNAIIYTHPYFQLALLNIIRNAIKYSYCGSLIQIFFNKENNNSQIIVQNIGIEINKKDIHGIYEDHKRTEEARKKDLSGMGYGLSLAKNVIEIIGGTIKTNPINNIADRNVFAINEMEKIINRFKSNESLSEFLKGEMKGEGNGGHDLNYYIDYFKLEDSEKLILKKYRNFNIQYINDHVPRSIRMHDYEDFFMDYIESQFKKNSIDYLIEHNMAKPISFIEFEINLKETE